MKSVYDGPLYERESVVPIKPGTLAPLDQPAVKMYPQWDPFYEPVAPVERTPLSVTWSFEKWRRVRPDRAADALQELGD